MLLLHTLRRPSLSPVSPTLSCILSPSTIHQKNNIRNMASATKFYDFKPLDSKYTPHSTSTSLGTTYMTAHHHKPLTTERGEPYDFTRFKGKVVLIVNTASKCGFTPQLDGLEKLYKSVKASPNGDSFELLGFPCNQFGGQDPGSNDTIQEFCMVNYGVTFPVLGKTEVNGAKCEPLYDWMKNEKPGLLGLTRIKWNFEKFLIGKDGKVKQRWASTSKPEGLKAAIEQELATGKSGL